MLALLLSAEHEDGSPMSSAELRDELVTALVAGHETTASQLAWGFEMLARNPSVTERLAGTAAQHHDQSRARVRSGAARTPDSDARTGALGAARRAGLTDRLTAPPGGRSPAADQRPVPV